MRFLGVLSLVFSSSQPRTISAFLAKSSLITKHITTKIMASMEPMFVLDAFGKRQFNNPDYTGRHVVLTV